MSRYETRYAIVAGVAWIRWTRVDNVEQIWLITFDDEPIASSHMETQPAQRFSGRIGDRVVTRAPGHSARLWGSRQAQSWGWAHASLADGRWAQLLTATLPGMPRLSQYATDAGGPGLPFVAGSVVPPTVRVGQFSVTAEPSTFIGLQYLDTDGSTIWCYHSERAHLRGPNVDYPNAAMEIAGRAPIVGWPIVL